MCLGNRASDSQAKPGVAAEVFALRAQGMEPFKDFFARFHRDAGPFVGDRKLQDIALPFKRHAHCATLGGERHGVVDQVLQHAFKPGGIAGYIPGALADRINLDPAARITGTLGAGCNERTG